ncbi:acetyltransferase (GNAT) family protein [Pseudoduganella flava]|uniref:Acetyltransferase (GNAT) family protein n=1 Tax=Pseudoduganella flava TaxID=871742 RepID=A0A562PZW3_9BURK|nr:GNAT family N-acetyltransferase [Pseudoduganella flava]QGZ38468.1 GNAT family N-acetyltransferase [Pseudoduganella flava]TWI49982.1 acetyltransferase (GNAT) family protein [Pseudoduganella flava]
MILATTAQDYEALLRGTAPRGLRLADTPIAPPEVLQMLADVAATVRATFEPASWLIVEDDVVVGMCSVTRPPEGGVIDIGYGIAPGSQGRGSAGRAIAAIVAWARAEPAVHAITAETGIDNIASQKVLLRAGFATVGQRVDDEDGALLCWRCAT